MDRISRRRFLEQSLLAAAAAIGAKNTGAEPAPIKKAGPNDRIHVACIGVKSRGMDHIQSYLGHPSAEIVAICDIDEKYLAQGRTAVAAKSGSTPKGYQDIRRLLEDKSIDAVSIATPNHWHALAAIWAMQAGKDVYVEKPVSHNVSEGRRIVETSRRTDRICQAGTQIRSTAGSRNAIEFIHSGGIGKVTIARGLCYKRRESIGKKADAPVPAGVDYNIWLGPAPERAFNPNRFHYNWHWNWDYGNGDLGNQGIHQMDVARWALNKNTLPRAVLGLGGRYGYEDDGQTPNTELTFFDYGDSEIIFEVRGLPTPDYMGAKIGNIIHGTNGYVVFTGYSTALAFDNDHNQVKTFSGEGDHFGNFLEAVRSRKRENLHGEILEGHLSSALCHLGNISYRLGKPEHVDSLDSLTNYADADQTLARCTEHLSANGIVLRNTTVRFGPSLKFNPKTETFVNNTEADALLTRPYRSPFVVPAKV